MMPLTKYFCINGYTSRIGVVEITMVAMVIDREDTWEFFNAVAAVPESLLINSRIELVLRMVFKIV